MSRITAHDTTLIIIDGDQLLVGDYVLVGRMDTVLPEVALLVLFPGEALESARPVRLVHHAGLGNAMAISRNLASRCGISDADGVDWELRSTGFAVIQATHLELELLLDSPSDQATAALARSPDLDGLLVYRPQDLPEQRLSLAIGGIPYRVRVVGPATVGGAIYVVSSQHTDIRLFSPNHRTGIDVVILADCSGSMQVKDLTLHSEAPAAAEKRSVFERLFKGSAPSPYISRSQAVREALLQLVERRSRSYGSSSRMALVSFGVSSHLEFPGSEGMVEIDGNATPTLIQQFKDRIATLAPRNEATNIAQALQFAASHLSNFGRPGNERLIVLLSDGADWHPKGDEATGEMLDSALDDPVSLMDHLHRAMNIRLHAIGISNDALYRAWAERERQAYNQPGIIPNHALLKELLLVGGGDAQRIGDTAVLEEYFQGLGAGVTLQVRPTVGARVTPTLSGREQTVLREKIAADTGSLPLQTTAKSESIEVIALCEKIRRLYGNCNEKAQMVGGFSLWNCDFVNTDKLFNYIQRPVVDGHSFAAFARDIYILVDEWLPADIRRWKEGQVLTPEAKQQIAEFLHGSEAMAQLATLRNKLGAHGLSLATRGDGASSSAITLAEAFSFYIGQRHVDAEDSATWRRLKQSVLESIADTLSQTAVILERYNRPDRPAPALANDVPPLGDVGLQIIADW